MNGDQDLRGGKEIGVELDACLSRLAAEGLELSLIRRLGKGAFLVTDGDRRFVLKRPMPPKNWVQRMAAWVFGGNLKFRREADFYSNLRGSEPFRTLPLVRTDGRTFLLIAFQDDARPLWDGTEEAERKFVQTLAAFQGARVSSSRGWLERRALQWYFGVSAQIVRFAVKVAKPAGIATLPRTVALVFRSWFAQRKNGHSINLHNDILYNIIVGPYGDAFVIDFEEVTRERRWVLVDIIEPAFDNRSGTLDWRLVLNYVSAIKESGALTVSLNLYAQLRMALLFRVTHAIVSKSTAEDDRKKLVAFYRTVLVSDEGYRIWFAENAGVADPPEREPEVVVTVPDLAMPGGVANYFAAIRPHLSSRVRYVTRGKRAAGGRGIRRIAGDYRKFLEEARRPNCRLVQINTSLAAAGVPRDAVFILLAKLFRKRVVLFIRGWDPEYARKLERYGLWLFRLVYFRCDCFLVLGNEFEQKLRNWGWEGRIVRETTAVEDALAGDPEAERESGRAGRSGGGVRLLFIGRMEKAKGIYTILEAVGVLRKRGIECSVTFAGAGPELAALRQRVAFEGIAGVAAPGQVQGEAKRGVFLNADIFVLPTRHGEGMPNSVLEAMAMGLPVVTTLAGGIKDFFQDERMGCLLEEANPERLADCVEKIWGKPELRRHMSLTNSTYARERFLASKVARRMELLWDDLIEDTADRGSVWIPEMQ